jgi:uncharacterized membrane protein HdeD (DUF308 family)
MFGNAPKNWRWIMALGVAFVGLGMIGLGATATLTIVSVLFFGWLLVIGGAFQVIQAIKERGTSGFVWHLIIAAFYLITGAVLVYDPVGAAVALTLLIAMTFFALGFIRVMFAFQLRLSAWWWPLIGGFASILLGAIIVAQWPTSTLWVIGLFIAIDMIINGWTYIMIALIAKRLNT